MSALKTADFDYDLPAELIAQQPLPDRAASRMLVVYRATGEIHHDQFRNLRQHVHRGDLVVLNDTKVIPARLWSKSPAVELLLVEKLDAHRWSALVKPGQRAKVGTQLRFEVAQKSGTAVPELSAAVEGATDFGGRVLRFAGDVEAFLANHGAAPLPPYIKHTGREAADLERYQTVFAREPGAIAAPTAGLHFTREALAQLAAAGIGHTFITLHVGLGTFRPVKTETVAEHRMHAERFSISAEAAAAMRAVREGGSGVPGATGPTANTGNRGGDAAPTGQKGRIVAVGTTVARTLETVGAGGSGVLAATGRTELFIYPPYRFRMVDALLTNFHLPRSTLLMLVSAFASRELIRRAYAEAVRERYRFYSFGDCMLIV